MVLRHHRKGSLNYGGDNLVLEDEDLHSLHDEDEDDENSQVLNPSKFNCLPEAWNISEQISQGKTLCLHMQIRESMSVFLQAYRYLSTNLIHMNGVCNKQSICW